MGRWVFGFILWGVTIGAIAVPFMPMAIGALKAIVSIMVLFIAFDRGAADAILQGDINLTQTIVMAGVMASAFMVMVLLPLVVYDRLVAMLRLDGLLAYVVFGVAVAVATAVLALHGPSIPTAEQWPEIAPGAAIMAVPIVTGAFVFWLVAVRGRRRRAS